MESFGVIFVSLAVSSLVHMADLFYFATSGRHITDELLMIANDWEFMLSLAEGSYAGVLLGFATVVVIAWLIFLRWAKTFVRQRPSWVFILLFLLVLGVFGGLFGDASACSGGFLHTLGSWTSGCDSKSPFYDDAWNA